MNYEKLVPSRELCEEMARLGICQDAPELFWRHRVNKKAGIDEWSVVNIICNDEHNVEYIIAPTLSRMMDWLPQYYSVARYGDSWCVDKDNDSPAVSHDPHLPNAVARALIAIKKGA